MHKQDVVFPARVEDGSSKRMRKGFGYYKDLPRQTAPAPTVQLPLVLDLAELVDSPKMMKPKPSPTCPRLRAARRKDGLLAIDEAIDLGLPESMVWRSDATKPAECKAHRKAGLWAFDTANSNVWNGAKDYMLRTGADFLASLEARVPSWEVASMEQATRNAGWRVAISPCTITEKGGKSAGVSIACRNHVGMRNSLDKELWPSEFRDRFSLKHVGAICRGGMHLGSCYLASTLAGITAPVNLNLLHLMAGILKVMVGPWAIGGDWNCTPEELAATGWLQVVGGTIVAPKHPTCGDRILDYFVVKCSLGHAAEIACTIADEGFGPHYQVRLYIEAGARHGMVRQLKVPDGFAAVLPQGPANQIVAGGTAPLGEECGSDYVGFLRQIVKELCAVESLNPEEAAKKSGREVGVKYCWKNVIVDERADSTRTTSVSRAWRRSAVWLGDIGRTKLRKVASAARWRLLLYKHPKPDMATATQVQLVALATFEEWQLVSKGMLLQHAVVTMMGKVAVKQAEKEERAARVASLVQWTIWLHEGPANGLSRQHRFTRLPTGWTQSAASSGKGNELGESDDLDGLSEDQLEALRIGQVEKGVPSDAQCEANDQADAWAIQWGSQLTEVTEPEWPLDLGAIPPKLMVHALLQAANKFPARSELGWDAVHPRAISRLSERTLFWLVEVLRHCEIMGKWPNEVAVVITALLPKSDGGLRPIGLVPFLPRLWCRARPLPTSRLGMPKHCSTSPRRSTVSRTGL